MAMMMNHVVEEGTARRAILPGIKAAGKTGTTNAYRDAWFVGYTGNYVGGVWFGNDDYTPLNRMTGGSLPAQTWHDVMAYAHQGIEIKNIPGLPPNPSTSAPPELVSDLGVNANDATPRPALLTFKGTQVLLQVERLMDDARQALASTKPINAAPPTSSTAPAGPPKQSSARDDRAFAAANDSTAVRNR
jgi:penicillin-binding protein 1A